MAHFNFVISKNAKWGHAGFYIDCHRMTSLLTCAWLISILWLVLGLQSKIKICVPENIILQKSTASVPSSRTAVQTSHVAAALRYVTASTPRDNQVRPGQLTKPSVTTADNIASNQICGSDE